MKTFLKFFQTFLLMCGVFAAETDEVKTVMEGEYVTLKPDITQIQGINLMLWRFGDPGPFIAQIEGSNFKYGKEKIFIDRLQLDQTGSLTIKNMKIKHSGLYTLEIVHSTGTTYNNFSVTVYDSPLVFDAAEAEMKIVSVTEGASVTLPDPPLYGTELIVWRSGYDGKLIAKYDIEAKSSTLYNTDERFRDRLQLNDQTGSLIITNSKTTDSGLYTVKISSNKQTLYKRFTVIVSAVPGLSPGAAGIVVVVVLLVAAAAVGVFYYRSMITNLQIQTLSVFPGDDVTLNPDTEIQTGDEIQWLFEVKDTVIAEIKKETGEMTLHDGPGEIFKNRLKLDETTGSLTIECINTEHTGCYTLKIRRGRKTLNKKFQVSVNVKYMALFMGDSACFLTGLTEIQKDDEIMWLFREKNQLTLIATIKGGIKKTCDGPDEIFKDSLELEPQTGNLTIMNCKFRHAGIYQLRIRSSKGDTNKIIIIIIRGGFKLYSEEINITKKQEETDDDGHYENDNEGGTGKRVNESNELNPLLNGEDVDVVNEQEGTSSL